MSKKESNPELGNNIKRSDPAPPKPDTSNGSHKDINKNSRVYTALYKKYTEGTIPKEDSITRIKMTVNDEEIEVYFNHDTQFGGINVNGENFQHKMYAKHLLLALGIASSCRKTE